MTSLCSQIEVVESSNMSIRGWTVVEEHPRLGAVVGSLMGEADSTEEDCRIRQLYYTMFYPYFVEKIYEGVDLCWR